MKVKFYISNIFFLFFIFGSLFSQENQEILVSKIEIEGNNRTKTEIVLREIEFVAGDTILLTVFEDRLERSKENLTNTSLFNFVSIDYNLISESEVFVFVKLVERWYILPFGAYSLMEGDLNTWWQEKNMNHIAIHGHLLDFNFKGRREQVLGRFSLGYDRSLGLTYYVPYINENKTLGLMLDGRFSWQKVLASHTQDYKYQYLKNDNNFLLKSGYLSASLVYRPAFRMTEQFSVSYYNLYFSDTLLANNPAFSRQKNMQYINLFSKFKVDYRDDKSYPLNGFYFDFMASYSGLKLLKDEVFLGAYLQTNFRFYKPLTENFYWASGINLSTSKYQNYVSYLGQEIGSSGNEIRGFELYRIPATHFAVLKNNLKWNFLPKVNFKLPFIKYEKISLIHFAAYLNLFADIATYQNDYRRSFFSSENISPKYIYSLGAGLDMVSYYDIVFRMEASKNFLFNQWGFFVHLKSSI
ncbi:MAG: hypothetical protein GX140_04985 [Bacteroidales bacterium]|jgi:outer membrane protein assembly factor BamA|nr:hypothetical protein [Bacteroidales bacterium]